MPHWRRCGPCGDRSRVIHWFRNRFLFQSQQQIPGYRGSNEFMITLRTQGSVRLAQEEPGARRRRFGSLHYQADLPRLIEEVIE